MVLQSLPTFEYLQCLGPLLSWAQYVKQRFYRSLSANEAQEKSVSAAITEFLPENERSRALKLAEAYIKAWNVVARGLKEIGENCDTLKLNALEIE